MMFSKIGALAILTLCFLVGHSVQEECAAQSVVNLELTASHILIWTVRPGEPCDINEFLVYIFHPEQPAEYAFTTVRNYVDVSFLEVCEEWTFVVVPVSGHTTGAQRRVVAKLPLPTGSNLTLSDLRFNHNPYTDRTHIHWDLANTLPNCSLEYRVTVEEFGSPVIEDFYVKSNSLDLHFLSSCNTYQFGVRAINIAQPTIEGPLKTAVSYMTGRKQFAPVVLEAVTGPTWANLSFKLESEVRNPCALKALHIDGDAAPISADIDLTNHNRSEPVNVTFIGLNPSTYYVSYIYIENIVGWSEARIQLLLTEPETTQEFDLTEAKIKE